MGVSRAVPARAPQSRVTRNDDRILDAAVAVAATDGWAGLSIAAIAAEAGLSRRPLQDRYADVSHLVAAAWTQRAEPVLESALAGALLASGTLDEGAESHWAEAWDQLTHPDQVLRAAAEILLISQFDIPVRRAVLSGLGTRTMHWCTPEPRVLTRADAGRRAYVLVVALGLLMAGRRPGIDGLDITHEVRLIQQAARAGARPISLPLKAAPHLDTATPFATGDATHDALLRAVLDQVGADGFDRASVERIAAAAGSSQGALFSRYATKLDLFLDATRRQQAIALRANEDYMARIAERHGRGVAEAVTIREFQRPGREQLRAITLEQVRLSWHVDALRDAQAEELDSFVSADFPAAVGRTVAQVPGYVHIAYAVGLGAIALPLLFPGCWSLPYDVVAVPLAG